jgi:Alpha/beta hydrolase domain
MRVTRALSYWPLTVSCLALACALGVLAPAPGPVARAQAFTVPPIPSATGPITGPGPMYPGIFLTPGAVQVEDFPYVTEEFFVSGTTSGGSYTTRMLVRRPKHVHDFSGIVTAEAMHTSGAALIFEWSRVSILTRGHIFVEIPTNQTNVDTIKAFNPARYASLAIPSGVSSNDIIAQFGRLIKANLASGPFKGYHVRHATLMGTSASSAIVRTYLGAHPVLRQPNGDPIYDGFLLTSTLGNTPLPTVDVPMVQMPTQTEVTTWAAQGNAYRRPDSDDPGNRFRLYEVAGLPHNNSRDNPSFVGDPCTLPVTTFPAGAFTAMGLNHLVEWIDRGRVPPHAPPIQVDNGRVALDEFGNAKGGVRNTYVDVPTVTYVIPGVGKTPDTQRLCSLAGTEVKLSDETLSTLYRSKGEYIGEVTRRLEELIRAGWFLPEYRSLVREDAFKVEIPLPRPRGRP